MILKVHPKKRLKIPWLNKSRCFNVSFTSLHPAPSEPRYDIKFFSLVSGQILEIFRQGNLLDAFHLWMRGGFGLFWAILDGSKGGIQVRCSHHEIPYIGLGFVQVEFPEYKVATSHQRKSCQVTRKSEA